MNFKDIAFDTLFAILFGASLYVIAILFAVL